jgi:hypothetical protein
MVVTTALNPITAEALDTALCLPFHQQWGPAAIPGPAVFPGLLKAERAHEGLAVLDELDRELIEAGEVVRGVPHRAGDTYA